MRAVAGLCGGGLGHGVRLNGYGGKGKKNFWKWCKGREKNCGVYAKNMSIMHQINIFLLPLQK